MYRMRNGAPEFLLAHPGGPLFAKKDDGHWTIPKGEVDDGDSLLETARREFEEETGIHRPGDAAMIELTPITQKGGKVVHAWAFEGDCDPAKCASNTFEMEWPPKSGRRVTFPEMDRAAFFNLEDAERKIKAAQMPLLRELVEKLNRH